MRRQTYIMCSRACPWPSLSPALVHEGVHPVPVHPVRGELALVHVTVEELVDAVAGLLARLVASLYCRTWEGNEAWEQ